MDSKKDNSLIANEQNSHAKKTAEDFLVMAVKKYKIFIDTCSLLNEQADAFWNHITPILEKEGSYIIVPYRVYQEVEKKQDDPEIGERAKSAKLRMLKLEKAGLLKLYADKDDDFADEVFNVVFTRFRMKYNLLLITQDKNLTSDILDINNKKSVLSQYEIAVRKINRFGYLTINKSVERKKESSSKSKRNTPSKQDVKNTKGLAASSKPLTVTKIPHEGDTLIAVGPDFKKIVKVLDEISSGGEGIVYNTNIPNTVAKIYKENKVDSLKLKKLKLMVSKDVDFDGVCFPTALLLNSRSEFVGFLMPKANGYVMQRSIFIPQLLKAKFPEWKKIDTVKLCITILKKIQYLHEQDIILGDINPNNILVESPEKVYFVDTDSYQIEGFPCPVGQKVFTAPEIQHKNYADFLRTKENEYFAIATLLFMIMLPGKSPYALQGGSDDISDNIINGNFAYASGERSSGKAPEGMWRYIWSHLPRYMKDDFYESFHHDGKHYKAGQRFSERDWLNKFNKYLDLLSDKQGEFLANDAMSAELFPSRLKKQKGVVYKTCVLCGGEFELEKTLGGYCYKCQNETITYNCKMCGQELFQTIYQSEILGLKKKEFCPACYIKLDSVCHTYKCENPLCNNSIQLTYRDVEDIKKRRKSKPRFCSYCFNNNAVCERHTCRNCKKPIEIRVNDYMEYKAKNKPFPQYCQKCANAVYKTLRCPECKEKFTISIMERDFYLNKNLELPKRCKTCRQFRTPAPKTGCFITTAVCEYFNKPDDCYELTILRSFRDSWLAAQPNGKALINEYYQVAPLIVEKINSMTNKDQIYNFIWDNYISVCIECIENVDYERCKNLYVKMISELKLLINDTEASYE